MATLDPITGKYKTIDTTPMAVPVGFKKPIPLQQQIQSLVRREMSAVGNIKDINPSAEEMKDLDADETAEIDEVLTKYEIAEIVGRARKVRPDLFEKAPAAYKKADSEAEAAEEVKAAPAGKTKPPKSKAGPKAPPDDTPPPDPEKDLTEV